MVKCIRISRSVLSRLGALEAHSPDREVCGLLLGHDEVIDGLIEADNVAADPRTTFEIDPRTLLDARRAARRGGPAVIGCYHSHPSGVARPSQRDVDLAEPGTVWLIIAAGEVTGWKRGAQDFAAVTLAPV
jgi:proteasome lid subunit RPN8/RPN11